MQDWVDVLERTNRTLKVKLKSSSMLDLELFDRFEHDDLCLGCLLENATSGIITYSTNDYIDLDYFLSHYTFENEDAYLFLINLFSQVVAANRNKPIVFDPKMIFVSPFGNEFRFIAVPVTIENWMSQKEVLIKWIDYLIRNLKTNSSYEINGYMLNFLDSPEFSLPNLILSLKALRKLYHPKKLFKKRRQKFILKDPIQYHTQFEMPKSEFISPSQEKTQIIGFENEAYAYLEHNQEKYPLVSETILIGRSMSCDVRIESMEVSLKHARITCIEDKYYIQDLKSSNKTYLNDKVVQRKMRLKDGMKLKFASQEFIFHQ